MALFHSLRRIASLKNKDKAGLAETAPPEASPRRQGAVRKVFVMGATGRTGRRVVSALLGRGVHVRAGVRSSAKAVRVGMKELAGVGDLEIIEADVQESEACLVDTIGDADVVVCATGFAPSMKDVHHLKDAVRALDRDGTINLINAAKKAGVQHFVLVSAVAANARGAGRVDSAAYRMFNPVLGVYDAKREAEEHLEASGLGYTVVRPATLTSDPPSCKESLVVLPADTLFGEPGELGRSVPRALVAEVVVESIFHEGAWNKIVEVVASQGVAEKPRGRWFEDV